RIAGSHRLRSDAEKRSDIPGKPIVFGPIVVDVRLCLRPRTIEQCDEPVMEDIEKSAEGGVAVVAKALARVLGDVHRERAIRPEQPVKAHLESRDCTVSRLEGRQRRRSKRQVRILAETHGLVDGPQRATPAWLVPVQTLEPPQRLIEVKTIRGPRQFGEKIYSVGLAPQCGVHRLISPRLPDRSTVSVNELIET